MPGFDGTGPMGMGPMTGGGRGLCAVPLRPARPAYDRRRFPAPYGVPWSMPYGGMPSFAPAIAREQELGYLKELAQSMRDDLKEIEARLQEIESEKE